jgi:uncharacterized protein DUF1367
MSEIYLRRVPHGFVPDTEDDFEACKPFKLGEVVKADIKRPRNLRFLRKYFALLRVAYQLWEETGVRATYKGEEVRPSFKRFRKDVICLAGYGEPVVNVRGEVRFEADSIAFGNMEEEVFEKLYNETINVILHKILRGKVPEARLREMANMVMEFA